MIIQVPGLDQTVLFKNGSSYYEQMKQDPDFLDILAQHIWALLFRKKPK